MSNTHRKTIRFAHSLSLLVFTFEFSVLMQKRRFERLQNEVHLYEDLTKTLEYAEKQDKMTKWFRSVE